MAHNGAIVGAVVIVALVIIGYILSTSNVSLPTVGSVTGAPSVLNKTFTGITPYLPATSVGTLQGTSILSLSQVSVASNIQGFNQQVWLTTMQITGAGQAPLVKPASYFTTNSAQLSNGQQDTLNAYIISQTLNYPILSSGQNLAYYNLVPSTLPVTYTDCNGNKQSVAGNINFTSGCLLGGNSAAVQSYYTGCKASGTGTFPVIVNNGTTFSFSIGIFLGPTLNYYIGETWRCEQLTLTSSFAQLTQLSGWYVNEKVGVNFNGKLLTVSNADLQNISYYSNGTRQMEINLLTPASTFTSPPLTTNLGSVITYIGRGNSTLCSYVLPSTVSSLYNNFQTTTAEDFESNPTYIGSVAQQVNNQNKEIQNICQAPQPLGTSGSAYSFSNSTLTIQDNGGKYFQPRLQAFIASAFVGIYEGYATAQVTGIVNATFKSGTYGTASITVKNVGSAIGSVSVSPTFSNTNFYTNIPSSQQDLAVSQAYTFTFPVFGPFNNKSQINTNINYQVCTGTTCQTVYGRATEQPTCSGTQYLNATTCVGYTTTILPVPPTIGPSTTTINTTCHSNCTVPPIPPPPPINWYEVAGVIGALAVIAGVAYYYAKKKT